MVLLATSDGEQFSVDKEVAERSVLIKNMLEGEAYPARVAFLSLSPSRLPLSC